MRIISIAVIAAICSASFVAGFGQIPLVSHAAAQTEIAEWHFHVYWHHTHADSISAMQRLHNNLLSAVNSPNSLFVAVCQGVELHRLNTTLVPPINHAPRGPHPSGSFEVWVPAKSFASALSWFSLNRQGFSVLIHPLTVLEVKDHTDRAMWLGDRWPLAVGVLSPLLPDIPKQYPELELGYSHHQALK